MYFLLQLKIIRWDFYGLQVPRICYVFSWNLPHSVHQPTRKHSLLLTIPSSSLPTLHRHLLKHTPSTCSAYLITRTSSWKAWSTFILILADASMYVTLSCLANCCPSSCVTWNGYSGCVWGTVLATPVGLSQPGYMHMVLLHLLESRLTHHKGWTDTTVPHNLKPTSAQLRRMHL